MDWLLAAIGLLIVIWSSYTLGHYLGYTRGEQDTKEYVQDLHKGKSRQP